MTILYSSVFLKTKIERKKKPTFFINFLDEFIMVNKNSKEINKSDKTLFPNMVFFYLFTKLKTYIC